VNLQNVRPGQVPSCRTCGTESVVLPGAIYGEADVSLFERIETSVRSLQVSRGVAERVMLELRDVALRANAPESVLLNVVDHLPTLHFLIPALHVEPTLPPERRVLTRATGMVLTIISARLRELASP
jgi:hypothetical protein